MCWFPLEFRLLGCLTCLWVYVLNSSYWCLYFCLIVWLLDCLIVWLIIWLFDWCYNVCLYWTIGEFFAYYVILCMYMFACYLVFVWLIMFMFDCSIIWFIDRKVLEILTNGLYIGKIVFAQPYKISVLIYNRNFTSKKNWKLFFYQSKLARG